MNRNIESFSAEFINKLGVDTILMSPPCQPFTRNGLKCDAADNRTTAFKSLLERLTQLNCIERILMENVKGFEASVMRDMFVEKLQQAGFKYHEFILSPSQFGVPNSRHRYYCLATKNRNGLNGYNNGKLIRCLNVKEVETFSISKVLDSDVDFEMYRIPEKTLKKRCFILDICYSNSKRSCCFTKAYGRYLEGTGSVYSEDSEECISIIYKKLLELEPLSPEYLEQIRKLKLRFFTPKEVCRLMSFPEHFSFPDSISIKQKYMLLGNSVNVKVVSELIKILNSFCCEKTF